MAKCRKSNKAKREAKRRRKELTAKLVARLHPAFGRWCSEHMPKGTKWEEAAGDDGMVRVVGDFLVDAFPSMDEGHLRRIATANVQIKERRINVDMVKIARTILRAKDVIS